MQKLNSITVTVLLVTAFIFIMPGMLPAGDLDPSGEPAATMHTLDEIYNKIDSIASLDKALVEKTGQTTSYDTGDDGDLQAGVEWPNPRFTDNNDGTVTDNLTGLIWLKNANCPNDFRTWTTVLSDVAQLNTDGTMNGNSCGDISNGESHQTDWRLATVKELQSLIDFGRYNPALPTGHPFTGVQSSYYWSSTTYAEANYVAWRVSMNYGSVSNYLKTDSNYVWPVRSDN